MQELLIFFALLPFSFFLQSESVVQILQNTHTTMHFCTKSLLERHLIDYINYLLTTKTNL